jgi:hypothetical protein
MLPSQRALFDIPREICYLNAASWSPLPIATQDAGRAGVARKGQPWLIEPAHPAAQYERARRAAARLINADADDVALISSVSYGVAVAAKLVTVPARSRVLVLENDHSSAVLEWTTRAPSGQFSVEVVLRPGDGDWTAAVLAAIERHGARKRRQDGVPLEQTSYGRRAITSEQESYYRDTASPARGASIWASAIISSRWRWRRSEWR